MLTAGDICETVLLNTVKNKFNLDDYAPIRSMEN
jgi:hypothetical protein